jgi:hypothetical protein
MPVTRRMLARCPGEFIKPRMCGFLKQNGSLPTVRDTLEYSGYPLPYRRNRCRASFFLFSGESSIYAAISITALLECDYLTGEHCTWHESI